MTQTARNILIIDDDGLVRENVVLFCERIGFDVTACATVAAGLEQAMTGRYGVVLVDCLLPDGNGMNILEQMYTTNPEISLIMMTGFPSMEAVIKSLRLGAVDYVIKPFNLFELKTIIERAASRHENTMLANAALHKLRTNAENAVISERESGGSAKYSDAVEGIEPPGVTC